jgi:hypothetical protein
VNALARVSQIIGVEVSRTSLQLPENLSFEQWQDIGLTLHALEGSVMWWVGDWLRYGETGIQMP